MESLTGMFNIASNVATYAGYTAAVVFPMVAGYIGIVKGPRQLKPENGTARVITARKWPQVWQKDKIVARSGPEMYVKWGASDISDIPLETFRVPIERSGKDGALILKDKVKARVNAEFFVRVDSSKTESIIQAMESLGGKITKEKIEQYCAAKFDDALRAAAAQMTINEIQTERKQFVDSVKSQLESLQDDGLILIDVALRQLDQAPIEDFEITNYFDAQGLEIVTDVTEKSRTKINTQRQAAETAIAETNKDEAKKRYQIDEQTKEAELGKDERISELESQTRQKKAEHDSAARRTEEQKRIAADQEIAVADEKRQKAIDEARIERTTAIKLKEADEKIALHAKDQDEAAAEEAASLKRAEAVRAQESVTTAKETEVAERERAIAVISARAAAEKETESDRIRADARLYVAGKGVEEAGELAKAVRIEAEAERDAATLAAEGTYAEIFQNAKAVADGRMLEATAQKALNDAINSLSDEAKAHLAEMARITMTPEAIREAMKAVEGIDNFNVTNWDGMTGMFGGAAGEGAMAGSNPIQQIIGGMMQYKMTGPLLEEVIQSIGGDKGISANVPGAKKPAAEQDNSQTPSVKAAAPNPS